ncbi:TPA: glycosyltransferase family 4 protein [Clostridium perfringens]|uniref:glycosyltransferase family 4 protein n=1 Tax=Clostridium perfringens TaxID=1502 RepID=UPI0036FE7F13
MKEINNVIVICDFAFTNGGSEKVAIESSIGLANRGKKVKYFCASGPIDERLKHENIEVICLGQKAIVENKSKILGMVQGIWNKKSKKELDKLLKKHSKDDTIVHLHLWQKALSSSVIKSINDNGFKVIFTMHHYFMACPNGGFFNYKSNKICDCKAMSKKCLKTNCDSRNYLYKIWRYIRLFIEQKYSRSLREIKNYIYISELGKNALEPYLDKDSKYYYIPNPIDINKDKLVNILDNDYYVYIGRLSKEKGVSLLAEAAKELDLNIVFVGEGDCREEIEKIYPKAKITGWLDKDKVKKYIRGSKSLIFPSLWYEGMPLSVLECLSNGIPVIVSDTCAANEVVSDGNNGYLFKNNDINDLKAKIMQTQDNTTLELLSKGAYESFWKNNYSLNAHLDNLLQAYNNIINDK